MSVLNLKERRYVKVRQSENVFTLARRLSAGQYFAYRKICSAIEELPPVDDAAAQAALAQCRKELVCLMFHNHDDADARRGLWGMTLSELLERGEFLLEGTRHGGELGKALAGVDEADAVFTIMRTFPAYKLHHFALMPVYEFLSLLRLAAKATTT